MRISDSFFVDAKKILSPNFSEREKNIDLIVLHSISLPEGEYNNDNVEDLFMNKLNFDLHSSFQGLRNENLASRQLMRVAYVDMHRKQKAKTIMDKKGSDSASLAVAPLSLSEKKACFKALSSGQQVERLGGVFVAEQDQDAHAG
jgi:hypothetical protein